MARAIAEDIDLTRHLQDAVRSLAICLAADESVRVGPAGQTLKEAAMGALTLSDVTKSFGKAEVIKGVDLEVAATASSASSSAPRAAENRRCCG